MADEVHLDDAAIRAYLLDPRGDIHKLLAELADEVAAIARARVRVRTGATRRSIETGYHDGPDYQSSEVSAGDAVFFLERGTRGHRERTDLRTMKSAAGRYLGADIFHPAERERPFLTTGLHTVHTI
jgi:hypothetical protein